MKAKQRHSMIVRLAEMQQLHVARERFQLVEAQEDTSTAEDDVNITGIAAEDAKAQLDSLLSAPSFCPLQYAMACQTMLLTDAEKVESERQLVIMQEAERLQRVSWHESLQKSKFLGEVGQYLAKKLARADDDKLAMQAAALIGLPERHVA
ncbi:MAG: hypothetical protein WA793_03675 [Sphingorhabdus sp.]|uniref:hypothetical protein n=1 Tax=Sphingorhabdus sp. TaxID=1902408 RepID=UPI003C9EF47D